LARTITRSPRSVPTSQLLSNLHWLPIHKRINFKVAILTYKVVSTQQPAYLYNLISYHQPSRSLRSFSQSLLQVLFPLQLLKSGIIHLPPLKYLHHLTPSNVTLKHTILPRHNFLTTWRLSRISDLIFFNFGALPNIFITLHYIHYWNVWSVDEKVVQSLIFDSLLSQTYWIFRTRELSTWKSVLQSLNWCTDWSTFVILIIYARYVDCILVCKLRKSGEHICCKSRNIEFFLEVTFWRAL